VTIKDLELAMDRHPGWTCRIVCNGRHGFFCEITIPSYEFQGYGETSEEAIAYAVVKLRQQEAQWDKEERA
jgi:hypothetical protein